MGKYSKKADALFTELTEAIAEIVKLKNKTRPAHLCGGIACLSVDGISLNAQLLKPLPVLTWVKGVCVCFLLFHKSTGAR